jgi:hypothetical protein
MSAQTALDLWVHAGFAVRDGEEAPSKDLIAKLIAFHVQFM